MTVQRGNAASIMGTLGPQRKLEDFFEIISPQEEKSFSLINNRSIKFKFSAF